MNNLKPDNTNPSQDDADGITWWNDLTTDERSLWLSRSGSAAPIDAWKIFKLITSRKEAKNRMK